MAVSIWVLAKNPFNSLLRFKQQNALRGLVTARCSVLVPRSKQVKFLHFLFLPWASIGRRLAPELWARVIFAGFSGVLVPWSVASKQDGLMGVCGEDTLHPSSGAVCHTAYENRGFPFSPEEEFRSNLLFQERAQELLLWCQRDSPKIKHPIFTA